MKNNSEETSLGIGKRYLEFFINNLDSRYVISIGGRRSGKSWANMRFLRYLISGKPKKLLVVATSFPALQLVMNDWKNATGLQITGSIIYGYSCQLSNGSVVQFRSWETPEKVQGSEADYAYIEEWINVSEQVIRVLGMSIREQIYMSANPTKKTRLLNDFLNEDKSNLIKTTYKDNPYLPPEQVAEFEAIKLRSLQPNATTYDIYCAKVYCDGEFGDLVGQAFEKLEFNTYEDYLNIPTEEVLIMDLSFGGQDKTALCSFKLYQNKLYVHTYMYKMGTINAKELAWDLIDCGINSYTTLYADYGGVGRQILDSLILGEQNGEKWTEPELRMGFQIGNVIKGRILESIMALMALDGIVIDDSNQYTREEFEECTLDENQKIKNENDHTIACARYAINYFHAIGK